MVEVRSFGGFWGGAEDSTLGETCAEIVVGRAL